MPGQPVDPALRRAIPESARAIYRTVFAEAAIDDEKLDRLIVNVTFSLLDKSSDLAEFERQVEQTARLIEVQALYKRYPNIGDNKWPQIVAKCVQIYRTEHGHMPRGGDLREIIRETLDIADDKADAIFRHTCLGHSTDADRFHTLWKGMAGGEPGLWEFRRATA